MPRSKSSRPSFLLLLTAVAALLVGLIIAPFAGALFAAAVFASVAYPLHAWLRGALGNRERLAAGLTTVGATLLAVLPLAVLAIYATEQLTRLYRHLDTTLRNDGLAGLMQHVPGPLRDMAQRAGEFALGAHAAGASDGGTTEAQLGSNQLEAVATIATAVFETLAGLAVDLGVAVVAFFFLLAQGHRLVRWIVDVLPLSQEQGSSMLDEFRDVTRGVFVATVATAFIQTVVATIGYVVAGIDYLPAMILVTFCAALIPIVGGAVVVAAVGTWQFAGGDHAYGTFLIAWGLIAVGLSDNVAKPWLAQGAIRLPGSVILFAMFGGIAVFGPMGIVAGPLIVAFLLAALRLLEQEGVVAD